ncbi:MAG: SDR family NAD(P)-dependent oxidoreductase, partial [Saprospiraceae bacterium]|nr:SDR family NAD(P)-dependent oxidoreductase [Saprospiraceae bacterium]
MKSLWDQEHAANLNGDLLKLRVYTSRLLGQEEDLVMHGGGNTSVKAQEKDIFGVEEDILFVKGSGWDLATIEEPGFAPVKLNVLKKLATLDTLTDLDMVRNQRMAMTNPAAPNPSVEAILHAIIPFRFVDHTHADAVVTITNTPHGEEKITEIFGDKVLIVPYVMPGFILAKEIYNMTRAFDWNRIDGMILMNHGVFTFDDDARKSYEKMIDIVSKAEQYLSSKAAPMEPREASPVDGHRIAKIRQLVGETWQKPVLCRLDDAPTTIAFSQLPDVEALVSRGPLTPDHIIRTKRTPVVLANDNKEQIRQFIEDYDAYFDSFSQAGQTKLDCAPRWAILPGQGSLTFGSTIKNLKIIQDISRHTMRAIQQAEQMGGWTALPSSDLFEVEYWSLEQEKLKKSTGSAPFEGQAALVTGAASGIGAACVQSLLDQGAVVIALDIQPVIASKFDDPRVLGIACDVTKVDAVKQSIEKAVKQFGGLDMLVSNAGI